MTTCRAHNGECNHPRDGWPWTVGVCVQVREGFRADCKNGIGVGIGLIVGPGPEVLHGRPKPDEVFVHWPYSDRMTLFPVKHLELWSVAKREKGKT